MAFLYDEKQISQITELNSTDRLDGSEYLLIQKEGEETKKITVDLLLANMVNIMNNRGTLNLNETDPTVPSYVKNITAAQVESWNTAVADLQTLNDKVTGIATSKVKISSFTCNPLVAELGQVINSVILTWETNNKKITKIVLDEENIDPEEYQITKPLKNITTNKTFTLTVTADDGETATRTVELPFENAVYWGTAENSDITSDFIKGLEGKRLQNNRFLGFTTVVQNSKFIYVAYPSRFGSANFKYSDGQYAEFDFAKRISFENAYGYIEEYYVYRSRYIQIGQTTIEIV